MDKDFSNVQKRVNEKELRGREIDVVSINKQIDKEIKMIEEVHKMREDKK